MSSFEAMMFALEKHRHQVRKYTGEPYASHLAEVAGIVATVAGDNRDGVAVDDMLSAAWLHDAPEDQGVSLDEIEDRFGFTVALGVSGLSDLEQGNRAHRKRLACERLSACAGWIQTIKCADLISNTQSIRKHDPSFAVRYLQEKRELLAVLSRADRRLWSRAAALAED